MKLRYTSIILFLLIPIFTFSQDIISAAFVNTGSVSLGQNASIQFNVNPITVCDTYTIEPQFDYTARTLNIKVNYTYVSNCSESSGVITEIQTPLFLMEAFYDISIELSVPNDPSLNETTQLGLVAVTLPEITSCNSPFIPINTEPCPINSNPVCACNGQNYNNECEAFFEDQNGKYFSFNCAQYVSFLSGSFECATFFTFTSNTFERYSCIEDDFPGSEVYLEYQHDAAEEPVEISFNTSDNSSRLFLVDISSGDLICLAVNQDNSLVIDGLNSGEYYLIFDTKSSSQQSIEFCIASNLNQPSLDKELKIYPNPSQDHFVIDLPNKKINSITIFNLLGQVVFESQNLLDKQVQHKLSNGTYQVQITTENGKTYSKKLIVNK